MEMSKKDILIAKLKKGAEETLNEEEVARYMIELLNSGEEHIIVDAMSEFMDENEDQLLFALLVAISYSEMRSRLQD